MRWHEKITEADARSAEREVCDILRLHIERPRGKGGIPSASAGAFTRLLLCIQLLALISFRLALTKPYGKDLRGLYWVNVLRISRSHSSVLVQGSITWLTKKKNREEERVECFLGRFRPVKKTMVA